jgi:hypothetical protein
MSSAGPYFGRYSNGDSIANPRLFAASGDLLRVFILAYQYGLATEATIAYYIELLVKAQSTTGGISTGIGFAHLGSTTPYRGIPEFRDVMPVVGWCDKSFRALSTLPITPKTLERENEISEAQTPCIWKRQHCIFTESSGSFRLEAAATRKCLYLWEKGTQYPQKNHL